eukprot:5220242-Alexandrium_andersonii.AAC.1
MPRRPSRLRPSGARWSTGGPCRRPWPKGLPVPTALRSAGGVGCGPRRSWRTPSYDAPRRRSGWTACSAPCALPASLPSSSTEDRRLAAWLGRVQRMADLLLGSR